MPTYDEIVNRVSNQDNIKMFFEKYNVPEAERYDFLRSIVASVSHYGRKKSYAYAKSHLPTKYAVIDIETTGFTKFDEIIQVAAVINDNGKEVAVFDEFVKPKKKIPNRITNLTGITNEMIAEAKDAVHVLKNFQSFISDVPIIGHNVTSFDLPFINRYDVDLRPNLAVDTLYLAQSKPLDCADCKLETLKDYYGLSFKSHNALDDCRATATIYEFLREDDITPRNNEKEYFPFFDGDKFCISGKFRSMSKDKIKQLIQMHGGKVVGSLGKNTDYFINGVQVAHNLTNGVNSKKELDYHKLTEAGYEIVKLDDVGFIELLEKKQKEWIQNA